MSLSGVRRSARRERDEGVGGMRAETVEIPCLEIFTTGKSDAIAANRAADLRINRAQIAKCVVR